MILFRLLVLCVAAVYMSGCAVGAKQQNMTYIANSGVMGFNSALENAIEIERTTGGNPTNPALTSEISNESFAGALRDSLISHGLYSEHGRYQLIVTILDVDQPLVGFNFTVTTTIRYILVDARTRNIILDQTISAPYKATVGDHFVGVVRLRKANEGSGKENIKQFLLRLAALDVPPGRVSLAQ